MNWLAHILVSGRSVDYQLGNLLADPLKGKVWRGCSPLVQDGFNMHRHIDAFTDSNAYVKKSKSRLGAKGHLKGVVIDIAYDYLLFKNWEHFARIDAISFIRHFHRDAISEIAGYPKRAGAFVERIITYGVLLSYSSFDGLVVALNRTDNRLSARMLAKETVSGYAPVLATQIQAIEGDFLQFFPPIGGTFQTQKRTRGGRALAQVDFLNGRLVGRETTFGPLLNQVTPLSPPCQTLCEAFGSHQDKPLKKQNDAVKIKMEEDT